jgi:hypothetical protein
MRGSTSQSPSPRLGGVTENRAWLRKSKSHLDLRCAPESFAMEFHSHPCSRNRFSLGHGLETGLSHLTAYRSRLPHASGSSALACYGRPVSMSPAQCVAGAPAGYSAHRIALSSNTGLQPQLFICTCRIKIIILNNKLNTSSSILYIFFLNKK